MSRQYGPASGGYGPAPGQAGMPLHDGLVQGPGGVLMGPLPGGGYGPVGMAPPGQGGGVGGPMDGMAMGVDGMRMASFPGTPKELAFFEKVRSRLGNDDAYEEFLKLLDVFTKEVVPKKEVMRLIQQEKMLGHHPDLLRQFKRFIGYRDDHEVYDAEMHAQAADRADGAEQGATLQDLDWSSLTICGPSYRELPPRFPLQRASGRTRLCNEVLNDRLVSLPSGREGGFIFTRHNQYEEALFRCEDDRYELDMVIDTNASTMRNLEPHAERLARMTHEERSNFHVDNVDDMLSAIERIYGEHAVDVLEGLRRNPAVTIQVVLSRLQQKDVEWRRARDDWSKVWREVSERNYRRSLDYQAFNFKNNDKKNTNPAVLVSSVKKLRDERAKLADRVRMETGAKARQLRDELMRKPDHHLCTVLSDLRVMADIRELVLLYSDHNSGLTNADREFVRDFWSGFVDLFFEQPESKIPAAETERASAAKDVDRSWSRNAGRPEAKHGSKPPLPPMHGSSSRNVPHAKDSMDIDNAAIAATRDAGMLPGAAGKHEDASKSGSSNLDPAQLPLEPLHVAESSLRRDTDPRACGEAHPDLQKKTSGGRGGRSAAVSKTAATGAPATAESPASGVHAVGTEATGTGSAEKDGVPAGGSDKQEECAVAPAEYPRYAPPPGLDGTAVTIGGPEGTNALTASGCGDCRRDMDGATGDSAVDDGAVDRSFAGSLRTHVMYCDSGLFSFFRLLIILQERLSVARKLAEKAKPPVPERAAEDIPPPTASPVHMEPFHDDREKQDQQPTATTETGSAGGGLPDQGGPASVYSRFMALQRRMIQTNMEQARYEDETRALFGHEAFLFFTLDKVVSTLVRHVAHGIAEDDVCASLRQLFIAEHTRARAAAVRAGGAGYAENDPPSFLWNEPTFLSNAVAVAGAQRHDSSLFRVQLHLDEYRITCRMLDRIPVGPEVRTVDEQWAAYVQAYIHSEPAALALRHASFLRGARQIKTLPKNERDNLLRNVVMGNGLECCIMPQTYKMRYMQYSTDYFFHPRSAREQRASALKAAGKPWHHCSAPKTDEVELADRVAERVGAARAREAIRAEREAAEAAAKAAEAEGAGRAGQDAAAAASGDGEAVQTTSAQHAAASGTAAIIAAADLADGDAAAAVAAMAAHKPAALGATSDEVMRDLTQIQAGESMEDGTQGGAVDKDATSASGAAADDGDEPEAMEAAEAAESK